MRVTYAANLNNCPEGGVYATFPTEEEAVKKIAELAQLGIKAHCRRVKHLDIWHPGFDYRVVILKTRRWGD